VRAPIRPERPDVQQFKPLLRTLHPAVPPRGPCSSPWPSMRTWQCCRSRRGACSNGARLACTHACACVCVLECARLHDKLHSSLTAFKLECGVGGAPIQMARMSWGACRGAHTARARLPGLFQHPLNAAPCHLSASPCPALHPPQCSTKQQAPRQPKAPAPVPALRPRSARWVRVCLKVSSEHV